MSNNRLMIVSKQQLNFKMNIVNDKSNDLKEIMASKLVVVLFEVAPLLIQSKRNVL